MKRHDPTSAAPVQRQYVTMRNRRCASRRAEHGTNGQPKATLNKLLRSSGRARAVLGGLTYCYVRCGSCAPSFSALPSLATLIERCPKHFLCVVKSGRPQEKGTRSI